MRPEKQLLLDEVKGHIERYDSFIIVSYFRLGANAANELRNIVVKDGGDVEVTRKRLLVRAAENCGIDLSAVKLDGHIGLIFSGKDTIETTKQVLKFTKNNDNAVTIIGGCIDGRMYGSKDVQRLSKLPGKDEMRAQLLATLEAPLSQTLSVIESLLTSVVYCLDNKCKQEGKN